jgi:YebC/PmpR family DNA-binding regulatory protein
MGKSWKTAGKIEMAQKKGALFTKLTREIAVAARLGGPDPEGNTRLKLAVLAAREVSCPKDTIERAIKKGSGQLEGSQIEELTYEGYGPHGVGVIVECQTDNKTRTVNELRLLFKTHGGNMGEPGAVAWMFNRVAMVTAQKEKVADPEEDAIEVGANDVEAAAPNEWIFYAGPTDLDQVRSQLISRGWTISQAELSYVAKEPSELDDVKRKDVFEFLEELEEFEDSHRVHATVN